MFKRSRVVRQTLVWLLGAALMPAIAQAQSKDAPGPPDPESVPVRLGPLLMRPTLALTNLGVDTNVYNVADSANPQSDFTFTGTPQADLWLRIGRTWVSGSIREDLVWYQQFENERAANSNMALGWTAPLNRLSFTAGTTLVHAKERPGFEIETRVQRAEYDYNGSVAFRALPKTSIGLRADRRTANYDDAEMYQGTNLAQELDRTETTAAVTASHDLTPLTSLSLDVSTRQDRFEFNPLRDSNSTEASVRFKFSPDALINGSAQFGYRNFKPLSSDVPGYTGGTMSVNLGYVFRGTTKMSFQAMRDVQYSYDVNQPYYLQTGLSGTVTQQIHGPVDVEGRVGGQKLAYQTRENVEAELMDRVDRVRDYGAGLGYRVGRDLRLGFNIDRQTRSSGLDGRNYSGLRFGTAVTYVF